MEKEWYYSIQKEVKEFLKHDYSNHVLQFQDVAQDRVYENYVVIQGGKPMVLQIVMHKQSGSFNVFLLQL